MEKPLELLWRVKIPSPVPASVAAGADGIWVADVESRNILLLNPQDGEVRRRIVSAVRRPQTISHDGEELWEYDEETMRLYRRRLADDRLRYFGYVEGVNYPCYGMAYHNRTLWLMAPDQPYFTVSNNQIWLIKFPGRIKDDNFEAPGHSCRGLSHDGRYLWTLDVEGRELFALDPIDGNIVTAYKIPDVGMPSSLVVQEERFHTIDLCTGELLTYKLNRAVPRSFTGGRRSTVDIVYTLRNNGPGTILKNEFSQILSRDYIHQRLLAEPTITPAPDELIPSQWDDDEETTTVLHRIVDMKAGDEKQISVGLKLLTTNLHWHIYPHQVGGFDQIPTEIRKKYLLDELAENEDAEIRKVVSAAEALFQVNHREIREKVEELTGDETNLCKIVRKLYNFVIDNVQYILPYSSLSSRKILKQGKGSCGNHATTFIALCEAAGIPARSIIGFGIWKDDSRLGYLDHEIPEFYLPGYGWVPADTSRFMSLPIRGSHPLTKFRSFGSLSDRFFVNGFGRDMTSEWAKRKYNREKHVVTEGECRPEELFFLRWDSEPAEWKQPESRPQISRKDGESERL